MSAHPSSPARSESALAAIAARLRAAGCVFAEDEADLLISAAATPDELQAMVDRRAAGLPLEHVVGWADFCGLRITVAPGVFVPRLRSEFLVAQAAELARPGQGSAPPPDPGRGGPTVILDLCCGSGAIGMAVAAALSKTVEVELHAVDLDPAAAACASANLGKAGGYAYEGDLCQPLPARLRGFVDLMIANAPYVPTAEIGLLPAEARLYEPLIALDGGADGVDLHRRIAAAAPAWLAPGGKLLIETSQRQAPLTMAAITAAGLVPQLASSDEFRVTVVIGSRPSPGATD